MDFHSLNHVYDCIPPVLGIPAEYEKYLKDLAAWEADERVLTGEGREACKPAEVLPVIVGLKVIAIAESDEDIFKESRIRMEKTGEEAQRAVSDITRDRIRSKVAYIKNLTIDGKEVTTFDDLYECGPPELISWVCKVVQSSYLLSRAERKN